MQPDEPVVPQPMVVPQPEAVSILAKPSTGCPFPRVAPFPPFPMDRFRVGVRPVPEDAEADWRGGRPVASVHTECDLRCVCRRSTDRSFMRAVGQP